VKTQEERRACEAEGGQEGRRKGKTRTTSRISRNAEPRSASRRYAPKAAAAARHEVSVIVALVAVLLRLLHGLVIVLLLAGGGGFGGRDRGRLFAARVHPEQAKRARKEKGGKIDKLDTPLRKCPRDLVSHAHSLSLLSLSVPLVDSRLTQEKKTPRTNYYSTRMRAVNTSLQTRANSPKRAGVARTCGGTLKSRVHWMLEIGPRSRRENRIGRSAELFKSRLVNSLTGRHLGSISGIVDTKPKARIIDFASFTDHSNLGQFHQRRLS